MKVGKQYIAGFFDGEGSIGVYLNYRKRGFYLRIQLTQNKSKKATELLYFLKDKYGGSIGNQITLSGNIKYSWQLGSYGAVKFLKEIFPFLILKKKQAEIATKWQINRPKVIRDKRGRICLKKPTDYKADLRIVSLLKALKRKGD